MTVVYKNSGIITGFNLPADISRLALGYRTPKKGFFSNGFMFHFNEYTRDCENKPRASLYKPRIEIKSIGDGRPLTSIMHPIWDRKQSASGILLTCKLWPSPSRKKSTLYNLPVKEFGAEHRKTASKRGAGEITPEYIDDCRKDVIASQALYVKLMEEYRRHPVPTKPNRLFSAAW